MSRAQHCSFSAPVRLFLLFLLAHFTPPFPTSSALGTSQAPAPALAPKSPLDTELDFETEDVQRKAFDSPDFVLSFAAGGEVTRFGSVRGQNVNQKPGLATLPHEGGAQTLITLKACSINQPHTHPRGTEFGYVTQGELFFGFIEENFNAGKMSGGRFLSEPIPAGKTFVIPQGLIHFAINRGCKPAQFLASFPTKDPGTQTVMSSLFKPEVPDDVLRATTGLSDSEILKIKIKVAENPNPSADPECLARCKAPK